MPLRLAKFSPILLDPLPPDKQQLPPWGTGELPAKSATLAASI